MGERSKGVQMTPEALGCLCRPHRRATPPGALEEESTASEPSSRPQLCSLPSAPPGVLQP